MPHKNLKVLPDGRPWSRCARSLSPPVRNCTVNATCRAICKGRQSKKDVARGMIKMRNDIKRQIRGKVKVTPEGQPRGQGTPGHDSARRAGGGPRSEFTATGTRPCAVPVPVYEL